MKFCEYQDEYSALRRYCKANGIRSGVPEFSEFYARGLRTVDMSKMSAGATLVEYMWWKHDRPYYNLWPSLYRSFSEFKVGKVPPAMYFENSDPTIAIQFPDGGYCGARSLLVSAIERGHFNVEGDSRIIPERNLIHITIEWNKIVDNKIEGPRYEATLLTAAIPDENVDVAIKMNVPVDIIPLFNIAIAVLLLERDPSIIEPDILKADMGRYENADFDAKKRLEERSFNRRGQRGYHIGRKFESIPHYRVPHPALVWTEKGRTVPKVIMRAGSVVHRQKMTDAPTGYHGPLVEDVNVTASNDT